MVSRALESVEHPVSAELAAGRRAWPPVANGLPASPQSIRGPVALAATVASRVTTPELLGEAQAGSVTGPGSQIVSLFRNYDGLSTRGWRMILAAIDRIESGTPAAARFARENVALYVESVYDGHFDLSQIAENLRKGYRKLGGGAAFGASLTPSEVDSLADVYSEEAARLHPHPGVRLGS